MGVYGSECLHPDCRRGRPFEVIKYLLIFHILGLVDGCGFFRDVSHSLLGKAQPVQNSRRDRKADPRVIEEANLVTEMKEIKHYNREGFKARDGIEK